MLNVHSRVSGVGCFRPSRHSPPATRACGIGNPNSELRTPNSQNGVALIITLILLSVVTFMAITFLALSRRERSAVSTVTDTASARLAADAALANAEAQIMANVLSSTNPFNFSLLVSTNYINANGFISGSANPTNVNYAYASGSPLNNLPPNYDFLQNLVNLLYSPRAPVYLSNIVTHVVENRFYLDLNRNGEDDPNGLLPVISPDPANPYYYYNPLNSSDPRNGQTMASILPGLTLSNLMVGDPEWIGVLQRPDAPHGPNNPFVARYAFIAVPVGNTLDLNAIHNNARRSDQAPIDDGFYRNQGVGSWEINLAAFLADLNTNQWFQNPVTLSSYYDYEPTYSSGPLARYTAFDDALSLLNYRYGGGYANLAWVQNLYPLSLSVFQNDIDAYSDWQPLMTTPAGINVSGQHLNLPWSGADNTNHFFTHQESFNPNESSIFFTNRLQSAGTNASTYGRYTFYRLLSQLGTDSAPESGKMNLNYDNLDPYTNGVAASTNFMAWTPIAFFTNAADRLLRAYTTQWRNSNPTNFAATFYSVTNFNFVNSDQWTNYPTFGIGNIPVLVSNQFVYSSAVNRLLQLAANIYDATTNRYYPTDYGMALPTLFQPVFSKVINGPNTNVYITNFVEFIGTGASLTNTVPLDLGNPVDLGNLQPFNLVYGVPIIVGAKKGLPNFNQFAMQSAFAIQRKLQITRTSTNATVAPPSSYQVNQMFNCSVSNQYAVECWNSYTNNYPRSTTIWVSQKIQMVLTNDETQQPWYPLDITNDISITTNNWTGTGLSMNSASFLVTNYNAILLPTETYQFSTLFFTTNLSPNFETNVNINGSSLPQPHWWLIMTNNIQVVLIDTASGRAIDYVQLRGPTGVRDLTGEILNSANSSMWLTNLISNSKVTDMPSGVYNQIVGAEAWPNPYGTGHDPDIAGLRNFYHDPQIQGYSHQVFGSTNLQIGVWFTAPALTVQRITWQANDPLVHYLNTDLTDTASPTNAQSGIANPLIDWAPNERYQPWNVVNQMSRPAGVDQTACNLAFKDPLVCRSDDWDFPTNKFPGVGWLGRVHRGTPWQTVYLKASDILTENNASVSGINTWVNWTGNLNLYDATYTAPGQDRLLFDLFTTAFNDNATRGTLSVNVGPTNANLAAWSALFSGVMVLSNNAVDSAINPPSLYAQHNGSLANFTAFPVNPAGVYNAALPLAQQPALAQIVQGINQTRANTNLFPLQTFTHVGDILSVPQITEQSPFLNRSTGVQLTNGISDEMYEWLPQQTMSLLRVSDSPRYVIYSYGQALKPAPNGIYTGSGQYFGMVTNYQVVSEIATRAVVRFGSRLTNNVVFDLNTTNWVSIPVVTNNNAVIESFNLLPPD